MRKEIFKTLVTIILAVVVWVAVAGLAKLSKTSYERTMVDLLLIASIGRAVDREFEKKGGEA